MTYEERILFVKEFNAEYGITENDGLYYINNNLIDIKNNDELAIAYTDGELPTLHKYGSSSTIKKLVKESNELLKSQLSPEDYEYMKYYYLKVPKKEYRWINVISNISASHWIYDLKDYLEVIDIELTETPHRGN